MSRPKLDIVILGLSITSSWGNGHATTYRALIRALTRRGHRVLFLERDVPWYADNRDMPAPPYGRTEIYSDLGELRDLYTQAVRDADLVIVGSYVPEGVKVGKWATRTARGVTAFYDIDTPVTLAKLARGERDYLTPSLIPHYRLYLSFTGGPTLRTLEDRYGSPMARPLYCSVDPELYKPQALKPAWDLGYMGTYSADRQPVLDALMLAAARKWSQGRFVVAGPQYPSEPKGSRRRWPRNVERIAHLPPAEHAAFYNRQRFTLNVTRADMVKAGFSPSVRLFEAAACGVPIISDSWPGLETFFEIGREILISRDAAETLRHLKDLDDEERRAIGRRARRRVLREHTADNRAEQLEDYFLSVAVRRRKRTARPKSSLRTRRSFSGAKSLPRMLTPG